MKRFIKIMSALWLFGAVAMASINIDTSPIIIIGNGGSYCDAIEQLMGVCRDDSLLLLNGNPQV